MRAEKLRSEELTEETNRLSVEVANAVNLRKELAEQLQNTKERYTSFVCDTDTREKVLERIRASLNNCVGIVAAFAEGALNTGRQPRSRALAELLNDEEGAHARLLPATHDVRTLELVAAEVELWLRAVCDEATVFDERVQRHEEETRILRERLGALRNRAKGQFEDGGRERSKSRERREEELQSAQKNLSRHFEGSTDGRREKSRERSIAEAEATRENRELRNELERTQNIAEEERDRSQRLTQEKKKFEERVAVLSREKKELEALNARFQQAIPNSEMQRVCSELTRN